MEKKIKAVLFDFDGVVVDTEGQYTSFWNKINGKYFPEIKDFALKIKGQTLVDVYRKFSVPDDVKKDIRRALQKYELEMDYPYIPGAIEFVRELRRNGVKTAVVTSSDRTKMRAVYNKVPSLEKEFDRILTSEDYKASKPSPDCFLTAAKTFGFAPEDCAVAEDSVNGLKAAVASGSMVIGLATTNPREVVEPYSDVVIPDFKGFTLKGANEVFSRKLCGKSNN